MYGDRVRLVWKHFPLSMHKDSPLAHAASVAAQRQGKFWEYHDRLFEGFPKLKREDLLASARAVGLDMTRFERDLADASTTTVIRQDVQEIAKLGVTGTPAFFINGHFLSGAKPFEDFAAVINGELGKRGLPVPAEAR